MPPGELLGDFYSNEYYSNLPEQIVDLEGFRRDFATNILGKQIKPFCESILKALTRYQGQNAGKVVHEIGCGEGRTIMRLAKAGLAASGSDISPVSYGFSRLLEAPNITLEPAEEWAAKKALLRGAATKVSA